MDLTLKVKKYKTEGDIAWEYNPLRNVKDIDGKITDFKVDNDQLKISLETPVDIECQQSYDGSVNLIINDDKNPPRIINNRITLLENNKYKIINRNQTKQSNIYNIDKIDQETRLFRNVQLIPKLQLNKVSTFGQLKGGNYVFYLKYLDSDFNETDIVAETGIVSIFKGSINTPKSCSGAIMNEVTDKSILLSLSNIDTSFTYFNLYYVRNTCDENGILIQEVKKINRDYEIDSEYHLITITGFEETTDITIDDLNIQYNYVESVKTQTQVQNMLFFGNVEKNNDKNSELRNLSLHIIAKEHIGSNIGFIDYKTFSTSENLDDSQIEYYSPNNIYYKLGYVPGEMYRFGIVYIFNDDHLSPVYNLRGIDFNNVKDKVNFDFKNKIEQIEFTDFLDLSTFSNTGGVFRFSKDNNVIDYDNSEVHPIGLQFEIPEKVLNELKTFNIKGFYFVRQKRIPNFIAQGYSIGVDKASSIPTLRNDPEGAITASYQSESFISKSRLLSTDYKSRIITSNTISSSGLLCIDAYLNKSVQALFNGSLFKLQRQQQFKNTLNNFNTRIYYPESRENKTFSEYNTELIYIDSEVPQRILDDFAFSTKVGMQEDLRQVVNFGKTVTDDKNSTNYIRGIFTPFIGTKTLLEDNSLYNIYLGNYNEMFLKEYFTIRIKDNSAFYTASDRYAINDSSLTSIPNVKMLVEERPNWNSYSSEYKFFEDLRAYISKSLSIEYSEKEDPNLTYIRNLALELDNILDYELMKMYNTSEEEATEDKKYIPGQYTYKANIMLKRVPNVYRGDCFTSTVCVRMHRNFTSATVPINDTILEPNTWKDNFKGARSTTNWNDISKADIDAVPIGTWFIYKCISNYNLGLRSEDPFNIDEYALMGNNRSFYPVSDISIKSSAKIPESSLLNSGYSITLGSKYNFAFEVIPYVKDVFDTRIMFSNVQIDGAFKNSYKVFQGLSYEDFDRQYGGITKILPWDNNVLCVFEHAIAIIPVNEKALIQTTEGQNIHMYGAGVLQKKITLISDIYGSSWKDSIIRTPRALYGVDTYAKKIWKFSSNGFELISEFKIQSFLNDNINLKQLEKEVLLGVRNVKTHFNAFKNDVMFTFYNKDKVWNICYNEVQNLWVTRYSWTPLFSGNLYNSYFSFDLSKTKIFGIINNNIRKRENALIVPMHPWNGLWDEVTKDKNLGFLLNSDFQGYNLKSVNIKGYSWNSEEQYLEEQQLLSVNSLENGKFIDIDDKNFKVTSSNIITPVAKLDSDNKYYWAADEEWVLDENGEKILFEDSEKAYQYVLYCIYKQIKDTTTLITFKAKDNINNSKIFYYIIDIEYQPYNITNYMGETEDNKYIVFSNTSSYSVGLLVTEDQVSELERNNWRFALLNNIYLHGRSGIVDEVNYSSPESVNRIFPTKWYNKQEPFEFEFVVNDPKGVHKIFDNLMIISNNAEPDSLEIEIVGDVYDFNKAGIFKYEQYNTEYDGNVFKKLKIGKNREYYTSVKWDSTTNEYSLLMHQDCMNIKEYGRRVGNIYYNADVWRTVIQPIYYGKKDTNKSLKSVRIRDKYAKIRVKYKGDKLAIITALQSIMTQVYV